MKGIYSLEDKRAFRGGGMETQGAVHAKVFWRKDKEDKGEDEAGGQTMPDLLSHVKDICLYLKSHVNPFKWFIQSWWGWSGLEVEI